MCNENFCNKARNRKARKVKDRCHSTGKYRDAAQSISNLRYSLPREIPVVILDGSNQIITKLAEKFVSSDFGCLSENTENHIYFFLFL